MLENKSTQTENEELLAHTQAVMNKYRDNAGIEGCVLDYVFQMAQKIHGTNVRFAFYTLHQTLLDLLSFFTDPDVSAKFQKDTNNEFIGKDLKVMISLFNNLMNPDAIDELEINEYTNYIGNDDPKKLQLLKKIYTNKLAAITNK
jgi:hypothetical protein